MDFLISAIDLLFFVLLFVSPVILLVVIYRKKVKYRFLTYLLLSAVFTGIVICFFAWWSYTSGMLLLKHYGYAMDGITEAERYKNVLPQHTEKVKLILLSETGIGWPLKAVMSYFIFIPYLFIVFAVKYLLKRKHKSDVKTSAV